jgi:NADH-quinone oxidoreductase subunit N
MRTTVLVPELLIAGAAVGLFVAHRLGVLAGRWLASGALVATLVALGLELWLGGQVGTLFQGGWQQDRFSLFAKAAMLLGLATLIATGDWDSESLHEVLPLAFLAAFGGMVVASATNLVALWAGVELAGISGVAVAGILASGAGLKLLRVSVLASALITVGFAYLYAVTGASTLSGLRQTLVTEQLTLPLVLISLLTLSGLAVRLGLTPFAAPSLERGINLTPVASGILHGLVAGTAVLALAKLLSALYGTSPAWSLWLGGLATLAMVVGGLRATAVGAPRTLIAWLTVQQVGWVAAGLATHDRRGAAAALFLLVPLVLAATAGPLLSGGADSEPAGVAGLGRREPARAVGLGLVLLSLAGVPPLAGFFGEFTVAAELLRAGLGWVLACGLLGWLLGAAGVVRALWLMYLEPGPEEARGQRGSRRPAVWTPGPLVPALLVLAYGFFANPIHDLAVQGAAALGLR